MIPVVTPEEMGAVDRAAPEPTEVLVERAGAGVARAALDLLGGAYGRRVIVVAGKGNNGADGRAAARRLEGRGVAVRVLDAGDLAPGERLPDADLVVDAAYGTGLGRPYQPPDPGATPVLAVDIPSGISGLTGSIVGAQGRAVGGQGGAAGGQGAALRAARTVTFAALKPGLLIGEGRARAGALEVVDIGVGREVDERARMWLVDDGDARLLPPRPLEANKWQGAVQVVAGSPGMNGAAWMVSRAALRAGAGYVRLGIPGVDPADASLPPGEVVTVALPADGWDEVAVGGLERFRSLVLGPGLGRASRGGGDGPVARLLARAPQPAVVDADGLNLLGSLDVVADVTARRDQPTVLTPHAGEFARLAGQPVGEDRVASVRAAAARSGAVVLLKGSTTVVAGPDGRALLATAGSPRLATAGTGDVLSGVVGAFLARGVPALEAAGLAAHVHGRAAGLGFAQGLVAGDLPELVARWLSERAA